MSKDDKDKQDRVISMAEFKKSIEEDPKDNIDYVLKTIQETEGCKGLIAICLTEDGYRFFSSTGDYREIVFGCEALKTFVLKDILDGY